MTGAPLSWNLRFCALGDEALLVTLSETICVETNEMVLRLCAGLERLAIPGVTEVQPAYSSFCVHIDPQMADMPQIEHHVRNLCKRPPDVDFAESRLVEIPVVYGGNEGPDLLWAAHHLDITPEELVRRHSSPVYRVFMIGFTPGFPYLGGMDDKIALPRLPEPRQKVEAGSVGIGGSQTGIYPWSTPGGWRLLGRTQAPLFSPWRNEPSLLRAGDKVKFVPTSAAGAEYILPGPEGLQRCPDSTCSADNKVGADNEGSDCGEANQCVPALLVEHPGFFTLVVDRGRFGYRSIGVPSSGAADERSYRLANSLCGNSPGAAALEITLMGGRFQALEDLWFAVSGAPTPVMVDGCPVPMNAPTFLPQGSSVEIGSMAMGCRAYLALAGGCKTPTVMGSRTTYLRGGFGGLQGRALKPGDVLSRGEAHQVLLPEVLASGDDILFDEPMEIRVLAGPEAEPHTLEVLCGNLYTVDSRSDRMGLRLRGPRIPVEVGDILSSPVIPGVVQVPSDGKPLVLLQDGQTTGGYKRIAAVVSSDLWRLGQLRPGASLTFRLIPKGPLG